MTAEIQEAMGYLDYSIKNLTLLIESKTSPSIVVSESTPWNSENPSASE